MVQPSSRREGFSAIPNGKWDNVGGLDLLRQEFDRYLVRRIKYPEDYEVIITSKLSVVLKISGWDKRLHWNAYSSKYCFEDQNLKFNFKKSNYFSIEL